MSYEPRPEFGERDGKRTAKLKEQLGRVIGIFLIIAASIAFYFVLLRATGLSDVIGKILSILEPILLGIVFAYILHPIVRAVESKAVSFLKKKNMKEEKIHGRARMVGIVAAYAFALVIISGLIGIILPQLLDSIRSLAFSLPAQLNSFVTFFTDAVTKSSKLAEFSDVLTDFVDQATSALVTWLRQNLLTQTNQLMSSLTAGVINIILVFLNIFIGMIVAIYLLFSKETFIGQLKKLLYAVLKPENANLILHVTRKSNEIFSGFVIGKIIDSAIIGVLCFIAMSIIKMPYALLVSVVIGVTNVIPFFGPFIGAVPSVILIMLSDWKMGIYFLILILVLQQLDGNIIGPKILGNSTGLSPFWVIVAILLGKGLFGFVGMLIGVPSFAVIYYIVSMFVEHRLYNRNLPTESDNYNDILYVDGKTMKLIHKPEEDESDTNNKKKRGKNNAD